MNAPTQFLYKIQPTRLAMLTEGPTEEEARLVSEHFHYLQRLCEAGVVKLAGRTLNTDASTFGIVIFEAADETAAHAIVDNDPAVKQGVMRAELYPYRIALMAKP
ncbi:MAG: hypothetical protein DYG89_22210 [Caldilinea sp. CFX5]|nr:hypothetical protein [Caldilinea sp. CFX5]